MKGTSPHIVQRRPFRLIRLRIHDGVEVPVKLAIFGIILVGAGLGLYAFFRSGVDVHWDLRRSHHDKDVAWPADNTSDFCTYERGAIHTAIADLPGLPQIKTTSLLFVEWYRDAASLSVHCC